MILASRLQLTEPRGNHQYYFSSSNSNKMVHKTLKWAQNVDFLAFKLMVEAFISVFTDNSSLMCFE